MRLLLISLSLLLLPAVLTSGSAAAADVATAPAKVVWPMELRICAHKVKHAKLIAAAQARQDRETAANAAWTNEVFESVDAKLPVGRWVTVAKKEKHHLFETEWFVTRKRAATATEPAALQILVAITEYDITSDDVAEASATFDEQGKPAIDFKMTEDGADRLGRLTSLHIPATNLGEIFRLSIIFNDRLHTAPTITSTISRSGQVSGDFTEEEAKALAKSFGANSIAPSKK